MNRVKGVCGVVIPIHRERKSWLAASVLRLGVFVHKIAGRVHVAIVTLNEKWREQGVRGAEIERIRLKEQARHHEPLPMMKWHGHY